MLSYSSVTVVCTATRDPFTADTKFSWLPFSKTSITTFLELKNRLNAYSFWMVVVDTSITVTCSLLQKSGVFSCSFPFYAAIVAFIVVYFRIKYFPKIKHDITICWWCKLDKTLKLFTSINMWSSLCATETILFGTSNHAEINELRHWIL